MCNLQSMKTSREKLSSRRFLIRTIYCAIWTQVSDVNFSGVEKIFPFMKKNK